VTRPPDLVDAVDERPPFSITLANRIQHAGVIAINLIYPLVMFNPASVRTVHGTDAAPMRDSEWLGVGCRLHQDKKYCFKTNSYVITPLSAHDPPEAGETSAQQSR
jgi:hypothetical protein